MLRKIIKNSQYIPLQHFGETRWRIMFDKVEAEGSDICYVSVKDYDYRPTTAEVVDDVIYYTKRRYTDEGLEPPTDIDVTDYVIPDGPSPIDEISAEEAINIITGRA